MGSRRIKVVVMNLRTGDAAFDPITRKEWLRTDNFPGFFGLIKSLFGFGPMPQILVPFYSAQKAWKQDPKLWRQFKQKLFSLIQREEENPKVAVPVE